ncbi:MAG: ABC transporter permease [Anaerolineae bacterium]|nr:ABC transporter permease [Anaerolineae bacterium]
MTAQSTTSRPALSRTAIGILVVVVAFALVLLLMGVVLLLLGKDPARTLQEFIRYTMSNDQGRADVIMTALPLLLCASGLLVTFTAGLWNIGIEGQIVMGSIFCVGLARLVEADWNPWLVIPFELLLAMLGGALWAAVAGLLKIFGNVNEIFGGVALNFIATNIGLWLLNGDWRESTYPQTAPFEAPALLPRLGTQRLSLLAIIIAVAAFVTVFMMLRGTRWGLQLKAMGKSEKSAFLLGVRTRRNTLLSMMLCGALAGLAGAIQVLFTYGMLKPGTSGGVGFTSVLIVLLVNVQPALVPLVTLFFGLVPVGSLKLASALREDVRVDTSLGNVFQSLLVLTVLLASGVQWRLSSRQRVRPAESTPSPASE